MKPHFTLNKNIVLQQYHKTEKISDIVSYSSKTNPLVTPILEQETDAMFSIHLQNELKNVKDKSRILFLAQAWNEEQIESLINQGINWFVVDNEVDLEILVKYLDTRDTKINLLLRLKLKERTLKTEKYYVFGMESKVINQKINELSNHKNINNLGIHFHRKTQNMAEWNLQYEIEDVIPPEVLNKITILNIGGGLPSNYANTNVKVIDSIFNKINDLKSWLQTKNIKLMLEPGRFIAAPAGKLHTEIIAIHSNTIIVNTSVYNSDMDALIVPVKLLVENELEKHQGEPYVIKGITPCSLDLFRYRVYLNEPKVGDKITFLNAGAYNFSTEFCDLEKLETIEE
ncbi:decarboxylase [Candidatus Woesearchaeota archaeon]|jgi:ornithine decarboxylase|nr:decarboxylase [Candidatus Woesearchaeota archaeon]MBT4151282.1 decarboxylase [Candidatus Woesearchaeota archaeon]MBT4247481.1 decarboxylase [Candidatus Woesearchaeota archaeon]MBT4434104.1 decarboxylase [Candidatus Woesearchaeota archaeon]MBT7332227.1 decarboxylase [Candidatus Woesearchaeota archaeon]